MVITLPPTVISFIRNILSQSGRFVDPVLDQLVTEETGTNKALLTPVMIGVIAAGGCGILASILMTAIIGESVFQLIVANLVSLSIIATTDIIITTLYGQFRMLDNQYLSALFALKTSNVAPDCDVVKNTLDSMFTPHWMQSIVNWFLGKEGY